MPDLGYADDFMLLADTPKRLAEAMEATTAFCTATKMLACIQKAKVPVSVKHVVTPCN